MRRNVMIQLNKAGIVFLVFFCFIDTQMSVIHLVSTQSFPTKRHLGQKYSRMEQIEFVEDSL